MRTRVDKVLPLEDLPVLVPDGSTVGIGGGWFANHPMAAIRQLLRADRRDLHVLTLVGSIEVELLIAAGAMRHLTFSMVSLEALGLPPCFRRAVQNGELPITEVPGVALQVALEASAYNVPFSPMRGPEGSDLVARLPDLFGSVRSPFGDDATMVVKAIRPEVAIVHALRADRLGNAQHDGSTIYDPILAASAERVIVTCEEIVEPDEIAEQPHMTHIAGYLVDAVVHAPFGAHPCSHVPRYAVDAWELMAYQRAGAAGGDELDAYVDRLRGETEEGYRERVLGGGHAELLGALADAGEVLELP